MLQTALLNNDERIALIKRHIWKLVHSIKRILILKMNANFLPLGTNFVDSQLWGSIIVLLNAFLISIYLLNVSEYIRGPRLYFVEIHVDL